MTNYEYIKSLNTAQMAHFLEAFIAIAIGTPEFMNPAMREAWLNTDEHEPFDVEKWEEENK